MADECLFCGIVAGTVPAQKVREDDETLTFADTNPQAPFHVLVIPRKHIPDIGALGADPDAAAALLRAIRAVAQENGLTDYRTVFNTGAKVGQSVFHVHAHVLSGRPMSWPPG
ncbi:MAG: histidine triad nucleotide-binding protein [Pseudonocardiales bacterium]|nr:histidine triad nucleotide-binding protein [Pseudonocardiales bacterium]